MPAGAPRNWAASQSRAKPARVCRLVVEDKAVHWRPAFRPRLEAAVVNAIAFLRRSARLKDGVLVKAWS